jgi:hypothetical protein
MRTKPWLAPTVAGALAACSPSASAPPAAVAQPVSVRRAAPIDSTESSNASSSSELDIDYSRWNDVAALCHPLEQYNEVKGCVSPATVQHVLCGSERDDRTACACSPADLACAMRCRPKPRPRFPDWAEPGSPAELADCTAQCKSGHAPSCLRLGSTLLKSRSVKHDIPTGISLMELSCRLGFARACSELFHLYRWLPESHSNPFAARLERSECLRAKTGFVPCAQAAEAYENGWGVARDEEQAARLRGRACQAVTAHCETNPIFERLAGEARARAVKNCIDEPRVCGAVRR